MTEPIKADAVLHQYMAATINGGPVLDEERSTELDVPVFRKTSDCHKTRQIL